MTTYPFGYGTQRLDLSALASRATVARCQPEFRRRLLALLEASGGAVGVGTAWRSPEAQDAERARRLATGTGAQMAPSGKSWHCCGDAVDLVGDLHWADEHCGQFGLRRATWGGEIWHFQPSELPNARPLNFVPTLRVANIMGAPPPQPPEPAVGFPPFDPEHGLWSLWPIATNKPGLRVGAHGDAVKYAQGVLKLRAGQRITVCDGVYGPQLLAAVRNSQAFLGLPVDGYIGPRTWAVIDMLASRPA